MNMQPIVEIESLTKDYEPDSGANGKYARSTRLSLRFSPGETSVSSARMARGKTTTSNSSCGSSIPRGPPRHLGHDIAEVGWHQRIGYLLRILTSTNYLTAARVSAVLRPNFFGCERRERETRTVQLLSRVLLDEKSWNTALRKSQRECCNAWAWPGSS